MKRVVFLAVGIVALLVVAAAVLLRVGGTPPTRGGAGSRTSQPTAHERETELEAARDTLHRAGDLESCRSAVQYLNAHLAHNPEERPRALTAVEKEEFGNVFALEPPEIAELDSQVYTPLDVHYLEQSLLFDDAARALRVDDLPPLDRALAGFRWAMREVRPREHASEPTPPGFTVRRGWGTAFERAVAFITVLQHLDLPTCMIHVPQEANGQSVMRPWVVGVLVDRWLWQDIYLFDPAMGMPIPGPGGSGVATLAQVRRDGAPLRQLTIDPKFAYNITPEVAKRAEVYIAVTLSSLTPRMAYLQAAMASTDRIRLYVDPKGLVRQFQAASVGPVSTGNSIQHIWSMPGNPFTPMLALRTFLPKDEGGIDASSPGRRVTAMRELLPLQALPEPVRKVPGDPGRDLVGRFTRQFVTFALEPQMDKDVMAFWLPGVMAAAGSAPGGQKTPEIIQRGRMPRDLMLRGKFDEATQVLVTVNGEMKRQVELMRADPKLLGETEQWCRAYVELESKLIRSRQERARGTPQAEEYGRRLEETIQNHWRQSRALHVLCEGAMAEPMLVETTYLLALTKHEQAERAQSRLDSLARAGRTPTSTDVAAARQAWKTTADWWGTYLNGQAPSPDAPAARLLLARARQALGQPDIARALVEDLSGTQITLQNTARLYLAKHLKDL